MATTMHKLLQKPLQQAIFPHLKLQNPLNLLPSLVHHRPNLDPPPEHHDFKTQKESNTIPASLFQQKAAADNGFHVFPSFSLGFFLDPKLPSGLNQIESIADESDGMWADSVKKKRKKKMNKHKLRKLRKRIRGYA